MMKGRLFIFFISLFLIKVYDLKWKTYSKNADSICGCANYT